jgi:transposase-like protein
VVVVQAVAGTEGVGKTHLAAAYARARMAEGWPLVAWINGENIGGILGGLAEISAALGLISAGDERRAGLAVRRWLEAGGDRCLIVFDDVMDPELVQPFLPVTGQARVIITSNHESAASLGAVVPIGAFTMAEGLAFLADRTSLNDHMGAHELMAELGGLPLALAQAAGVIIGQGLGYATYLERLRSMPIEELLLPTYGGQHLRAVAAAVLLSLETVQNDDRTEACGPIMDLLSVLSPAGATRSLLHSAGAVGLVGKSPATSETVDRALGQLAAASLVTFSIDESSISAHRLVMRIIRAKQAAANTFTTACESAAAFLDARAAKLWQTRHQDRPAVRNLVRQITALQDAVSQCPSSDGLARSIVRLRGWAVTFLNELGDSPAQAILMAHSLAADQERILGAGHPDTLASRDNLGASYRMAGRADEAIALHEQTLAAGGRVLGADHPDTLASRNNLALAYRAAGRTDEAIALHEQTLAARGRVLGADHPDTLASRNNLALAYRAAGRTDEAIALHEQTLAARGRVLGADHPSTLASRNNLALAYRAVGRTDEAIALNKQTMASRRNRSIRDYRFTRHPWLTEVEDVMICLSAKGLTHGEIAAHLAEVYGAEVPEQSISAITGRAMDGIADWQSRPLDPVYAVIFVGATQVKIRGDQVANRPIYLALGVTADGERDFLGLWAGEHGDEEASAKFWLRVLSEINNRGTQDVCMVVSDGLNGLPEAVSAVWEKAIVKPSIVHLLRNSPLRYARLESKKDWNSMAKDLKSVYTAASETDAVDRFTEFCGKWATRYPAIIQLSKNAWPELAPFLQLDWKIRTLITTNAIESLNAQLGRSLRARGHFPTVQAALKHLYLVITNLDPTGLGGARWTSRWKATLNTFDSTFEGRLSAGRKQQPRK